MRRSTAAIASLVLGALVLVLAAGATFVQPPAASSEGTGAHMLVSANVHAQATPQLRGMTSPTAAVAAYLGAMSAGAPEPAQALSETELNRFGLFFMVFFLGFWLAAFARLLSIGRL
mmetsp:Transcript_114793/g.324429  ORF Transcript_114793/g.324429 Transcript_114793/m.324429 type:complete len:117 (+) Transcript_114793:109-459(+)